MLDNPLVSVGDIQQIRFLEDSPDHDHPCHGQIALHIPKMSYRGRYVPIQDQQLVQL